METLKLAVGLIQIHKLIKLIHDVTRDPLNYDYLNAGQYKDLNAFLNDSTRCLLEFSESKITWDDVIDELELCEYGKSHFRWYCKKCGCK